MNKLFAFVLGITITISILGQENDKRIEDLVNQPLPEFRGLLLSGDSINSADLKDKVTLIQFLFFGCAPCMHETFYFNELYDKMDKSEFDLIVICAETYENLNSFNNNDSTSKFHFLHDIYKINRINYKIIAECTEENYPGVFRPQCSDISDKFYLRGYPYSILVDKKGIIRKVYGGFNPDKDFAAKTIAEIQNDINNLIELSEQ